MTMATPDDTLPPELQALFDEKANAECDRLDADARITNAQRALEAYVARQGLDLPKTELLYQLSTGDVFRRRLHPRPKGQAATVHFKVGPVSG